MAAALSSSRHGLLLVLGHDSNRPDKAQQFTPDGGYDLGLVFSTERELAIALMQTMLSLLGDLSHFLGKVGLSFEEVSSQPR